ncbi:MAG: tetratricopeptide repeat protein [Anaerolineales bacterium]
MDRKPHLAWILPALLLAGCVMPAKEISRVAKHTNTPFSVIQPSSEVTITLIPTEAPTPTLQPSLSIESGDSALSVGDWEKALTEYQLAFENSSDSEFKAVALFDKAKAWMMARNYFQVVEDLNTLIQNYPDTKLLPEAYFYLGEAHNAQQQYSQAADAYLNYLALNPGVVDAYVLNLRGDALFASGDYTGAVTDYLSAIESGNLLDNILLQMKAARANALAGQTEKALAMYDDIKTQTSDEDTLALIAFRKGQIYSSLGQIQEAWDAYLEAVVNFPTSLNSYNALIELVEQGAPVSELDRGIVDFYAGQYGVAIAALERYLQDNPGDRGTGLYYYGLSSSALGNHESAINAWDDLIENHPDNPNWASAVERKSYTQWFYLELYEDAIKTLLNFAENNPTHKRSAEFIFTSALIAERAADLKNAAELFSRVVNLYPEYENAHRALLLSGIARYRTGEHKGAEADFERLLSMTTALDERASALLWIGKSRQAEGDLEGARSSWEHASSVDPTGYYSERARDLLNNQPPFEPPENFDFSFNSAEERQNAEAWLKTTFGLAEGIDFNGPGALVENPFFLRGTELWKLGRHDEARVEFEYLRGSIAEDAVLTYRLINYLYDLGIYRTAILAARGLLDLALMDDAETLSAPVYFNHIRFGPYYKEIILTSAQDYGFHPLFIFSVARQESLFDSTIRSSTGATGLMQIIPATGAEIFQNLGWPPDYESEDLTRPIVNITFGTDYLDTQRKLFEGDLYSVLAAYNGGPGNTITWREISSNDPDVFLETIRFEETRKYIRTIYEVFNIFRWLYNRPQ